MIMTPSPLTPEIDHFAFLFPSTTKVGTPSPGCVTSFMNVLLSVNVIYMAAYNFLELIESNHFFQKKLKDFILGKLTFSELMYSFMLN